MMRRSEAISIGNRVIGDGHPIFIIAEAGVNHDGSVQRAHALIDAAAAAGADAVKLQIVNADASYVPGTPSYETFLHRALSEEAYEALRQHAADRHLMLLATPADPPSLDLCGRLKLPALKISSGLMTNTPLILRAAAQQVPLIISTGGAELWEVARLVTTLEQAGVAHLALLHCVSVYPTPPEAVSIRAVSTLRATFPYPVGYSDHTLDSTACVCAAALGATIIEKHLTLDRSLAGADHSISAEPGEFQSLVRQLRVCSQMLRNEGKHPAPEEADFRLRFRRRLVAARDIARGERLTEAVVSIKRPLEPGGLDPGDLPLVIGRRATRAIRRHEPIGWDALTERDDT